MNENRVLRRRDFLKFAGAGAAGILATVLGLSAAFTASRAGRESGPAQNYSAGIGRAETVKLSETEHRVLRLYYFEEMPPREIGDRLGLSESEVSQMHADILDRLRAILRAV